MIAAERQAVGHRESRGLRRPVPGLGMMAGAALALALIPAFIQLGFRTSYAIPLSLLIGLASQHLFRLVFNSRSTDLFQPASLVCAYFLSHFALRAFYLAAVPFTARIGRNPYDDYLEIALWSACAGFIAFSVGSGSQIARAWGRRLHSAGLAWPQNVPSYRILAMLVISLACLAYMFNNGQVVGNFGNRDFQNHPPPGIVILLENLVDLAWIAALIGLTIPGRKARKSEAWLLLGLCMLVMGARLAVTGGKIALIEPMLEAALVIHYGTRRFRIWEMLAIGLPTLLLAFGIVNFYRFVVVGSRGSPKSVQDLVSRVSTASDLLTAKGGPAQKRSALDQMVERDAGVDALALVMKYTPHPFPFYYGTHLVQVPLTFMPRQLWKDKPIDLPSVVFETTYLGESIDYNGFSSIHLISDMYRNFAMFGILGGMFLFGVVAWTFYLFCSPSRQNPAGIFIYAALFPEIIHSLEADLGNTLVNLIRLGLLVAVAAAFLGVRYRSPQRMHARAVTDPTIRSAAALSPAGAGLR